MAKPPTPPARPRPLRTPILYPEQVKEARVAEVLAEEAQEAKSEEELIGRVRAKIHRRVVRNPVPLPEHMQPQIAAPAMNLGQLVADSEPFEVTEEDLDDAADASYSPDGTADSGWEDFTKQMIRSSCAFFAQEVLTGPARPPYDGRFFVSEHHEEWDNLVSNYDRICVLAPRDHGKTYWFDFAYPLWKASITPWGKGFILSATAPQAERILEDIIAEVEGNPELHWLIPTRKDSRKWSSKYVRFSNGHRIYARGFGTKVRGFHPDWIVVDDGLNDETAYSEMVRRKQTDYFYNAISNMLTPGGQLIVVGTPFHKDDLYADLSRNEEYEFRRYQAMDEHGKALWPERYSMEEKPPKGVASLPRKKREVGSIRFTREFLCEPMADDMSLFPLRLFKGDPTEQPLVKLGMPAEFWDKAGVTQRFMGVDFAMSSNVSADYTVVWTMGLDDFGNRWIIDIQRGKGLPYQEQLSMINSVAKKYDPGLVFVEDNQLQRIFGDELIRTTDIPIRKFTTGVQKHALDKGVPSLRVLLENGKFRIPRGDKYSVEMTDIWIDEMRSYTWQDGKLLSVGGHDDTVMGCWICDQAIRFGGFKFSFGDEDFDGSLDDFMDEIMGKSEGTDNLVSDSGTPESQKGKKSEKSSKAGGNGEAKPLEGEDLLRALVKQQMGGGRRAPKVPGNGGGQSKAKRKPVTEPDMGELVDESKFW